MRKKIRFRKHSSKSQPVPQETQSNENETLDMLADIVIERIVEEKNIISERMKNDPEARKVYGACECKKCWIKRFRIAIHDMNTKNYKSDK